MKRFSTLVLSCLLLIQLNVHGQTPLMTLDTNFYASDNNEIDIVNTLVKQNGKLILGGSFRVIAGMKCNNICRLLNDSVADPGFNIGKGFNNVVKKIVVLPGSDKLLVMGSFTSYSNTNINYLMRLNADGSPDLTFIPNFDSGSVLVDFAIQADGKVVVIGLFTTYSGYPRKNIVRLLQNGNLDLSFNSGDVNNGIFNKVLIQSTGKIILTGTFDTYLSNPVTSIVRLLSNGNFDNTFSCALDKGYNNITTPTNIFIHENDEFSILRDDIYPIKFCRYNSDGGLVKTYPIFIETMDSKLMFLANGNILYIRNTANGSDFPKEYTTDGILVKQYTARGWIGHNWAYQGNNNEYPLPIFEIDGQVYMSCTYYENYTPTAKKFIRLAINEVDRYFLPSGGPNFSVTEMAKYASDKFILLGGFSRIGSNNVQSIAMVDSTCRVIPFKSGVGFNGPALSLAVQEDGKIIVGGDFTSYNNQTANRLVRLLPNGDIDPTFVVGTGLDYAVYDIEILGPDKILIAGVFSNYQGVDASNMICLNYNGSINSSFTSNIGTGTNGRVRRLHKSGSAVYVIGDFNYYNGHLMKHIFRINLDGSFDPTFDVGQGDNGLLNDAIVFDDKVYLAGGFTLFGNQATSGIVRLNTNGSIDPTYQSSTNSGYNIEFIDSTMIVTYASYSNFQNGTASTQSSSFTGNCYTPYGNGYYHTQGLFYGGLSYWPEIGIDSGNYYLKHLKIFVDGHNVYLYGSCTDDGNNFRRANFIEKYKYTPAASTPLVVTPPSTLPPNTVPQDTTASNSSGSTKLSYTIASGQLTIIDANNSTGDLRIYDVHGAEQLKEYYQTNTGVNISNLNPGIYIIKFVNADNSEVSRIKIYVN